MVLLDSLFTYTLVICSVIGSVLQLISVVLLIVEGKKKPPDC